MLKKWFRNYPYFSFLAAFQLFGLLIISYIVTVFKQFSWPLVELRLWTFVCSTFSIKDNAFDISNLCLADQSPSWILLVLLLFSKNINDPVQFGQVILRELQLGYTRFWPSLVDTAHRIFFCYSCFFPSLFKKIMENTSYSRWPLGCGSFPSVFRRNTTLISMLIRPFPSTYMSVLIQTYVKSMPPTSFGVVLTSSSLTHISLTLIS